MSARSPLLALGLAASLPCLPAEVERLEDTSGLQPIAVNAGRLALALDSVGRPLPRPKPAQDAAGRLQAIQRAYDPHCVAAVTINPESRVSVEPGPVESILVDGQWEVFLVKVLNQAGVTAPLRVVSSEREIRVENYSERPLNARLSGAALEYRLLAVRPLGQGRLSSTLTFDIGAGSGDLGFRSDLVVNFVARKPVPVMLRLRDEDGKPTTAAFEFRDSSSGVWPPQVNRVEPDFRFHPQVYRKTGEQVELPAGEYTMSVTRGPEYHRFEKRVTVAEGKPLEVEVDLERWIDASDFGYWSGDHHIHAAGCKHYTSPSEGVHAEAMLRHIMGEDLKVGANLTWGPCFDYQKRFFTGRTDKVSRYPYLLRYDVEVSGFGSHRSGHLCLLRLRDQIYPGGDSKNHWPTLCLNTLQWAQKQGAVCGPAHSGWGLNVKSSELPNLELPPYDGIGANEYIVDVTHVVDGPGDTRVPAVDFLSMCDTPYVWELNIWYHTLNCGFRTRVSGETDFPCIYGERVGLGRSYMKLDGKLDYDAWCQSIELGRGYVSDGLSHLIDFTIDGVELGTRGSEVRIPAKGTITATAKVAAMLPETPRRALEGVPYTEKPYWHLERARRKGSREVAVELLANGRPVARRVIQADGELRELVFEDVAVEGSSWLALRILGSSHTNPIWVVVGDQPVHASKASARWCLDGVEQCWRQKQKLIAPAEMDKAKAAYDHARRTYREIIATAWGP